MRWLKYAWILLVCIFGACATPTAQKNEEILPSIEINSVKISSITPETITFGADISITNPFPSDLELKDTTINIYYQDKIIDSRKINGSITLKALSKSDIALESSTQVADLFRLIRDYNELDSITLSIEVLNDMEILKEFFESGMYLLKERIDCKIPPLNLRAKLSLETKDDMLFVALNVRNRAKAEINALDSAYYIDTQTSANAKTSKNPDNSIDITFAIEEAENAKTQDIYIKSYLQVKEIPYIIPFYVKLQL